MRKLLYLMTVGIVTLFSLIGCGRAKGCAESYLEEKMLEKSGILQNEDYLSYEGYAEGGRIDDNGYYAESTDISAEERAPVHITFSNNNNLQIQYYTDADKLVLLNTAECYLNPGDSFYAVVGINADVISSTYEFAGFRIYEVDDSGTRKETDTVRADRLGEDYVLSISYDYHGSELAVEPIGTFRRRTVSLSDYCVDDNGNKTELNGTWLVNDKEYSAESVEISPVSSYIISYQYDSDEYFYLSSDPECYYNNNTDGIVIFKQREPSDSTPDYSVELHEYITVSLVSDMDRYVSINGGERQSVAANAELNISKLRYGQTVVLTTNREWPDLEYCRDLILTSSGRESGNYKYNMLVPERDGEFLFDPSDYSYEHGTLIFTCFGNNVTSPQILAKGSKIYYEQNTAEEGYWLAPGDNFIIVGDESTTKQQLRDIHFTQMVQVTVALEQPAFGGTITYKVDGNKIYTNTYSTYSGTIIEMDFDPWEGWILNSNAHDGDVYIVKDSKSQIVRGNGYEIGSVFTEDKNHKPVMTVTLKDSVGTEMEFSISASGFKTDVSRYGGGIWNQIKNGQDIITNQIIGTESPIMITMGNRALQSGQAVKFVIEKTDSSKQKHTESETRYITDMTQLLDPIYIYKPDELATSKVWYESIHITIGVVDIETFAKPIPSRNTFVQVRNMQTNTVMQGGELIEGDHKVSVTITPEMGYYVTGKRVTNDIYQETMKYSEYIKKIHEIIEQHPAKKYLLIKLDTSDSFAIYQYKLDGETVNGTVTVKEGQKLTLVYEITDSGYKLKEGAGGIPLLGWGKSYKKVTKDLIVTVSMDGKIITKESFGIIVEKGA